MATQYKVEFTADVKSAIDSLKKLGSEANKSLSSITSQASTTAKATSALFALDAAKTGIAVIANFTNAIVNGFSAAIDAASNQQDAINELNAALEGSSGASTQASKDLVDYAEELERTTKFSSEAIIKTEALFASLTDLSSDGIKEATKAAANLAAVTGKDLNSATELLIKSASNGGEALKKYKIEVTKGLDPTATLAEIVNKLNSEFAGRATKDIETYSGAITQSGNAYDDVIKTVGGFIVNNDAVISAIKATGNVFRAIETTLKDNEEAFKNIVDNGVEIFLGAMDIAIDLVAVFGKALDSVLGIINSGFKFVDNLARSFKSLGNATALAADETKSYGVEVDEANKIILETTANQKLLAKAQKEGIQSLTADQQKLVAALVEQRIATQDIGQISVNIGEERKKQIKSLTEEEKKAQEERKKAALSGLEEVNKKYQDTGLTQIELVNAVADREIAAIQDHIRELERLNKLSPELRQQAVDTIIKIEQDAADKIGDLIEKEDKATREQRLKNADKAAKEEERIAKELVDAINTAFSFINQTLSLAFNIADAKQDLKVLEDELAKLNSNIDVDVNANIQDFSDKLSRSLNDVIETNAKSIQAFEKGIPEQLAELEDSIRQASEERISSIEDAAKLEESNLQQGAALQFKLDQEEAKKKAGLELTQSLARIQAEYDAGLISAEELDTLTKEMQLESATELQEQLDELALNSELELNASVEKLKLDTEQKVKEEKLNAEREIINEKKKREEELLKELAQLRIDSDNEINELNKANEEEIRQRKLDLEAEIAGQRLDLEAQIAQQQNELNQQTQKSAGDLLGSVTGAVLNVLVPGIGGAAGQFVSLLSGSGEQLSAAIDSLFDAIPGVINNIADNLPVIITKLAENAGVIVGALAEAMPEVALALVKEAPSIALALINGIAEGLKGIINGIISVINELPGIDIPKLATGGTVPAGFANDTFPANLSSGEMVIPKDDVSRLSQFLDKQDSGGMSRADIDSVVKAIDKTSTKNVTVQIRLGENELANAILTLNRQGFRLA